MADLMSGKYVRTKYPLLPSFSCMELNMYSFNVNFQNADEDEDDEDYDEEEEDEEGNAIAVSTLQFVSFCAVWYTRALSTPALLLIFPSYHQTQHLPNLINLLIYVSPHLLTLTHSHTHTLIHIFIYIQGTAKYDQDEEDDDDDNDDSFDDDEDDIEVNSLYIKQIDTLIVVVRYDSSIRALCLWFYLCCLVYCLVLHIRLRVIHHRSYVI